MNFVDMFYVGKHKLLTDFDEQHCEVSGIGRLRLRSRWGPVGGEVGAKEDFSLFSELGVLQF